MDKQRETELTRALMDGHAGAFEEFVEHFRSKIFQYSWLMCGQREDAEEVAQETLLRVFGSFSQLREPERVRPWVFRIAKNACLMKRRKSIFAPMQELSLDELGAGLNGEPRAFEIGDSSSLPEDELLRSELRVALHRAVAELPETYRAVVLLRDLEELSTEETAQILDITSDAVKTRLHRARLALRQKLGGYLRSAEAVG
ncbi:MAG: sigma-70 family RNA polymerase sigma factor [Bryobacteraceae bacterium]